MNLPLSPTIKKLLTARKKSSRYSSMEDLIAAAAPIATEKTLGTATIRERTGTIA